MKKSNNQIYSSVTEDFLDLRTRSLMEEESSWSSLRLSLVTSSGSLSNSSFRRSSPCPVLLFWLTNCFTTKPWYLTKRVCWSCGEKKSKVNNYILTFCVQSKTYSINTRKIICNCTLHCATLKVFIFTKQEKRIILGKVLSS